jgi:hypothetical protein
VCPDFKLTSPVTDVSGFESQPFLLVQKMRKPEKKKRRQDISCEKSHHYHRNYETDFHGTHRKCSELSDLRALFKDGESFFFLLSLCAAAVVSQDIDLKASACCRAPVAVLSSAVSRG